VVHFDQWLSEDGGRMTNKRNKGLLVELPEGSVRDIPDSFKWMSLWQIKECLHENAWVNPHVRGIIAHL
jgi:oxidase EvaA